MELHYYLNILWRRKWLIVLAAIIAGLLAFILISRKAPVYKSQAILSTGVIDYTGINSGKENPFLQKLQVDMHFNNLMEFVTSRRCLNLLSFHLLNHDLDSKSYEGGAFRKDVDLSGFKKAELEELKQLLATKLKALKPEFEKSEQEYYFNKVAKAFEYDYENLKEYNLRVQRMGETDYVKFYFESENPQLSAFAASKYSKAFIDYYKSLLSGENDETIKYLTETSEAKKDILEGKEKDLENYRKKGELVDLETQREATVNQIKDLEQEKNKVDSDINSSKKTIADLDALIKEVAPEDSKALLEEEEDPKALLVNKKIVNLRKQERELTNNLIEGVGNKRKTTRSLRLVKKQLQTEMKALANQKKKKEVETEANDNTIANELFDKRVDANITLISAKEHKSIIENKLKELRLRAGSYVTAESYVQNLQREIEIAKEEYEDLVKELNKEQLNKNRGENPLKIIEHAQLPEKAESDKKLLFTLFSAVVGGSMATFFIFLLTFLDNTLNSPNQFKVLTGLPLLGTITKIKERDLDLKALFSSNSGSADLERFKELIRDLRFNFEKLGGGNTFLITSPREGEGKSFVITLLAHALLQKQKKVLVIDTNFKRNTLSTWAARPSYTSASLHQLLVDCKLTEHFAITSLKSPYNNSLIDSISNSGRNQSPLEGLDIRIFQHFIQELKLQYDYVLMEGAALNHYSDTKELLDFCDNVIAVFNSSTTLKQADKNSIAFLKSLGGQFAGSILNSVNRKDLN